MSPHTEQGSAKVSHWPNQPPASFAFVMATGIVSSALLDAEWPLAAAVLLWIAVAGLVLLLVGLVGRIILHTADAVADFRDPHRGFGYLTMVAAINVVGIGFHPVAPSVTWILAFSSIPLWLFLAYGVPLSMMLRTEIGESLRPRLLPVDGTWFLWVVSTQSLSMAAASLASGGSSVRLLSDAAVAFWGIGIMLYLTLTTLVILRLLTGGENLGGIVPTNWIFMGATAITVLAGSMILHLPGELPVVHMAGPTVGGISYLLWAFGLWWVPLLVAFGFWHHVVRREPLRYTTALWSIVFPLGMFAVATFRFGRENEMPLVQFVGQGATWIAVFAWVVVAGGMAMAFLRWLRRLWHRRVQARRLPA
ncbi:tellurite resistance/C4-dicarboxylate transporter family protein [Arthrobacter sp. H35-D1]|uniref:tellurite resistance/C4-dicarboxylate transporter family protein n=1 Tax=Arthrobacter sp. H35-D1 TaxID=3046202 RepID=UPI0024BAE3A8|nr:tellurite resistance/C4-dicarboxylate transporter family protein [Arthrobacter sp. H35-D1]MDJ0315042.1 tellurite resistance/C4-dicarboxylate transporter family protein [Arthrobacter sp. H35-D1]